jgi:hypothetical protein
MAHDWKERLKRIEEANKKLRGRPQSKTNPQNKCAMCGRGWRRADKSEASILDNQLRYCRQCAKRRGKI